MKKDKVDEEMVEKYNKLTHEMKAKLLKDADLFVKNVGWILKKLSKE